MGGALVVEVDSVGVAELGELLGHRCDLDWPACDDVPVHFVDRGLGVLGTDVLDEGVPLAFAGVRVAVDVHEFYVSEWGEDVLEVVLRDVGLGVRQV